MSKRSECSIFLITDSDIVRADFSGRRNARLLSFQKVAREVSLSPAESLELVLGGKGKVGRQCWVFETSVWSQIVSVPQRSIEDIQPDELKNALKFEVETLSGVEAENSALGIHQLHDEDRTQASFWINVATSELFENVSQSLKRSGAKWVSLAHPAGFATETERGQTRVELWENVAIRTQKGLPPVIAGLTPRWQEQLGLDPEVPPQSTSLWAQSAEMAGENELGLTINSLENEETLKSWLQAAAQRGLSESAKAFPVIKTFDQVVSTSVLSTTFYRMVSVGLVSLFCFWHWNWLDQNQKQVAAEIIELEKPALRKRALDQQLAQIVEQHSKLDQDANAAKLKIKKIECLLEFQKDRLGRLLERIKELRTNDLVIQNIELHENGIVISGLALKSKSAAELAQQLTGKLQSMGWRVNPASQIGKNQLSDGGPYEFSILLEDIIPDQLIPTANNPEKLTRRNVNLR